MTTEFPALSLILIFPLLGVLFNLFAGARMGRTAVNIVGPGVIFAAFGVAVFACPLGPAALPAADELA